MGQLRKGRYLVREAVGVHDLARAHALRALCFQAPDQDAFDARCTHILVEDTHSDTLVCCFRVLSMAARDISHSYSAQFYDLTRLSSYQGQVLELGRFCIHPDHTDPDILRMAWAWLTGRVDAEGITLLFGCASFAGAVADVHLDAFAYLHSRHRAPAAWRPGVKAGQVFEFGSGLDGHGGDVLRAKAGLPPLLRSYLGMGGWVSDHAVFDRDLGTMHVFTAVEIALIPPMRATLLRAWAKDKGAL
ncbi:GNAT family N-acetyltransferase (plasmid) [Pseudorhodobacter turbinis]|uniref:L-ornithine N(alpha)-acyltransferase n=1 Tax=Pseudorhodobacter turbinis TaxID=2500533 RepID=A0A4P8ELM0_9RHOB|nr:GNAT family N-acetyltransferase [Pseudorhodobacter turbinis]